MKLWLKRNLASGIIVIAPIAVTFYVIYWVYSKFASLPGSDIFNRTEIPIVNEFIKVIVSIVLIVALLLVVGSLVRTAFGVILQNQLDKIANRIPGIRLVYNATKMGIQTLLGETEEFQKPAKLDVQGLRFTVFKTGNRADDGREIIFLPTAPNITSGLVIEVKSDRIIETEEDTEDALTRILSAGFGDSNWATPSDVEEFAEEEDDEKGVTDE
ncbi:MAG: DUF502 domain-containing protein [Halobacteria archaeon]|nr:DUF502 domain-containing protein [Halobacteria archaeon]